jgi:hypothetical protein
MEFDTWLGFDVVLNTRLTLITTSVGFGNSLFENLEFVDKDRDTWAGVYIYILDCLGLKNQGIYSQRSLNQFPPSIWILKLQ